jgi:hypothetical protein
MPRYIATLGWMVQAAAPFFCPEEFYASVAIPALFFPLQNERRHMIFLFPSFLYIREPPTLTKKGPTLTKKGKIPGQISQKGYDHHKKGKITAVRSSITKKGNYHKINILVILFLKRDISQIK